MVLLLKGQLEIKQNKNNTKKIIINKIKKRNKIESEYTCSSFNQPLPVEISRVNFFVECILKGLPDLLRQTRVSCNSTLKEIFLFQGNEFKTTIFLFSANEISFGTNEQNVYV